MKRLARALAKQYSPKEVEFLTPQNCQPVQLRFPGEKIARVVGSLAEEEPSDGMPPEETLPPQYPNPSPTPTVPEPRLSTRGASGDGDLAL